MITNFISGNTLVFFYRYRHENIISLCGYAFDGDELCLVYQYMPNGSLYTCLHTKVGSQFYIFYAFFVPL